MDGFSWTAGPKFSPCRVVSHTPVENFVSQLFLHWHGHGGLGNSEAVDAVKDFTCTEDIFRSASLPFRHRRREKSTERRRGPQTMRAIMIVGRAAKRGTTPVQATRPETAHARRGLRS